MKEKEEKEEDYVAYSIIDEALLLALLHMEDNGVVAIVQSLRTSRNVHFDTI